jgi:hypothetical protein
MERRVVGNGFGQVTQKVWLGALDERVGTVVAQGGCDGHVGAQSDEIDVRLR